jgi:Tfp pilus assembly protein PilV
MKHNKQESGDLVRGCAMRSGQSLMELLIAMVIGIIMVMGAAVIIAPALRSDAQTRRLQVAVGLGRELLDGVRVFAESDWQRFVALQLGAANSYYLSATSSQFVAATGTENVQVATTTFTRYFYVNAVGRDGSGMITGAANDPSTREVVVAYGLLNGPTGTISTYLTRTQSYVFVQTDWSGGGGQDGPLTAPNSRFSTSSGMNYASTTGSITIDL